MGEHTPPTDGQDPNSQTNGPVPKDESLQFRGAIPNDEDWSEGPVSPADQDQINYWSAFSPKDALSLTPDELETWQKYYRLDVAQQIRDKRNQSHADLKAAENHSTVDQQDLDDPVRATDGLEFRGVIPNEITREEDPLSPSDQFLINYYSAFSPKDALSLSPYDRERWQKYYRMDIAKQIAAKAAESDQQDLDDPVRAMLPSDDEYDRFAALAQTEAARERGDYDFRGDMNDTDIPEPPLPPGEQAREDKYSLISEEEADRTLYGHDYTLWKIYHNPTRAEELKEQAKRKWAKIEAAEDELIPDPKSDAYENFVQESVSKAKDVVDGSKNKTTDNDQFWSREADPPPTSDPRPDITGVDVI